MEKLKFIKKFVEGKFGIPDLSKDTRVRSYTSARAVYYKLAKEETKKSYIVIGSLVKRNHATVTHGINVIFPALEVYDKKAYEIYKEFKELSNEERDLSNIIRFDKMREKSFEILSKNILLKKENTSLKKKNERLRKVKDNNELFEIIDRFNDLPEQKKEYFKVRVNAMLNMIK